MLLKKEKKNLLQGFGGIKQKKWILSKVFCFNGLNILLLRLVHVLVAVNNRRVVKNIAGSWLASKGALIDGLVGRQILPLLLYDGSFPTRSQNVCYFINLYSNSLHCNH